MVGRAWIAVFSLAACRTGLLDVGPATGEAGQSAADASLPQTTPLWPMRDHDPQRSRRSPLVGPDAPRRHLHSIDFTANPSDGRDLLVAGDGAIVAAQARTLRVLSPLDLSVRWTDDTIDVFTPVSAIGIGPDGRIYVSSEGHVGHPVDFRQVAAFDLATGRRLWMYGMCAPTLTLLGDDGTLYGGCVSDHSFAITPGETVAIWSVMTDLGAIVMATRDGLLVEQGGGAQAIRSARTGALAGAANIEQPYCLSISALGELRCLRYDQRGYFLSTLALPDGNDVWDFANFTKFPSQVRWAELPSGGLVMLDGAEVYRLDPRSRWTPLATLPAGRLTKLAPTLDADGNLYFSTHDGSDGAPAIVSLDPAGKERWTFPLADGARYVSSPISIGAGGMLLFTTCVPMVGGGPCRVDALAR